MIKTSAARRTAQEHFKEDEAVTEKEQATNMIDIYTDLLRIKQAEDKEKEVNNQLRKAKAKLEALGVVVEDLTID